MSINLIIFPLIIFLGIFLGVSDGPRNRKIFIYIVSTVLLLQTSLRSVSVGSDTINYYELFMEVQSMSWSEIWDAFLGRYFFGTHDQDIGYNILQKLFGSLTGSWQGFVFFANLLFFVPLGILMYRYTTAMIQLVFAYVLYTTMFHIISLSGGRQLYSIGFTLLAFLYMDKRRFVWSLAWIVAGLTIHMTTVLFLVPLLLSRLNPKYLKKIHLFSFAMVPVVLMFTNQIIILFSTTVGMEEYSKYGMAEVQGGTSTFITLLLMVSLFCYIAFKDIDLLNSKSMANLYIMVPLFTVLGPLIHSNGSMIRISMYFHLYMMLLIPLAVNRFFKGFERTVVYSIVILVLMVLSLRDGGLIYHFYWQEPHLIYASD